MNDSGEAPHGERRPRRRRPARLSSVRCCYRQKAVGRCKDQGQGGHAHSPVPTTERLGPLLDRVLAADVEPYGSGGADSFRLLSAQCEDASAREPRATAASAGAPAADPANAGPRWSTGMTTRPEAPAAHTSRAAAICRSSRPPRNSATSCAASSGWGWHRANPVRLGHRVESQGRRLQLEECAITLLLHESGHNHPTSPPHLSRRRRSSHSGA